MERVELLNGPVEKRNHRVFEADHSSCSSSGSGDESHEGPTASQSSATSAVVAGTTADDNNDRSKGVVRPEKCDIECATEETMSLIATQQAAEGSTNEYEAEEMQTNGKNVALVQPNNHRRSDEPTELSFEKCKSNPDLTRVSETP